jgi:hypothetical protein
MRGWRIERGLFASGPRFALLVLLLSAAATGPSVAVAVVGLSAMHGTTGPPSTPVVASAPPPYDTVVVPEPSGPVVIEQGILAYASQDSSQGDSEPDPSSTWTGPVGAS